MSSETSSNPDTTRSAFKVSVVRIGLGVVGGFVGLCFLVWVFIQIEGRGENEQIVGSTNGGDSSDNKEDTVQNKQTVETTVERTYKQDTGNDDLAEAKTTAEVSEHYEKGLAAGKKEAKQWVRRIGADKPQSRTSGLIVACRSRYQKNQRTRRQLEEQQVPLSPEDEYEDGYCFGFIFEFDIGLLTSRDIKNLGDIIRWISLPKYVGDLIDGTDY